MDPSEAFLDGGVGGGKIRDPVASWTERRRGGILTMVLQVDTGSTASVSCSPEPSSRGGEGNIASEEVGCWERHLSLPSPCLLDSGWRQPSRSRDMGGQGFVSCILIQVSSLAFCSFPFPLLGREAVLRKERGPWQREPECDSAQLCVLGQATQLL